MKIYTKTGDAGQTGLFAGGRVSKNHPRVAAYGDVDELNAAIGLVLAEMANGAPVNSTGTEIAQILETIQHDLFTLGAELATPDPQSRGANIVNETQIDTLESSIDNFDAKLSPLKNFILPGGCTSAALLHMARTICRRAERATVELSQMEGEEVSANSIIYMNRLSDLLFVMARLANRLAGSEETPWCKMDPAVLRKNKHEFIE